MSALNTLKLVAARKQPQTPTAAKRAKLIAKLHEQIELIKAQQQGETYTATRTKWSTDQISGTRTACQVHKSVRQWHWTADNGKINAVIKYGATSLALGKGGKNAIEVANTAELTAAYDSVKQAVLGGELDDAIAEASQRTRKGFGK